MLHPAFTLFRTRKDAETKYRRLRYLKNKYELLRNSEFFSMDYKSEKDKEITDGTGGADSEKDGEAKKNQKKVRSC